MSAKDARRSSTADTLAADAVHRLLTVPVITPEPSDGDGHTRAFRTLLDRPFLVPGREPDVYLDIQRRKDVLREWFASRAQWRIIGTDESLRVQRIVEHPLPAHGLTDLETVLDFELLCLTMYYAEGVSSPHFTLSDLTASIAREAGAPHGVARITWTERSARLALRRVLQCLQKYDILHVVKGNLDAYVDEGMGTDGVAVVEAVLMRGGHFYLFNAVVPEGIRAEDIVDGRVGALSRRPPHAGLAVHHRVYRALLTGPALYRLSDPDAFALLQDPDAASFIAQDLRDQFGWDLELTAEYAAVVREQSLRNRGRTFPESNDVATVVLLAADTLRARVQGGAVTVSHGGRLVLDRAWFLELLDDTRSRTDFAFGKRVMALSRGQLADEAIDYVVMAGVATFDYTADALTLLPTFARVIGQPSTSPFATHSVLAALDADDSEDGDGQ
jgi:uncharacterized protein (TIGR02678 family)